MMYEIWCVAQHEQAMGDEHPTCGYRDGDKWQFHDVVTYQTESFEEAIDNLFFLKKHEETRYWTFELRLTEN